MQIEVLKTERNNDMLNVNGYLYVLDKKGVLKQFWECQQRRNNVLGCSGRLHTTRENGKYKFVKFSGQHSHEPTPANVEVCRFVEKVKKDAKRTNDAPDQIIGKRLQEVSTSTQGCVPVMANLKKQIQRARGNSAKTYVNPHRREDIDLPNPVKTLANGTSFVLFDSGNVTDRIMIFGTKSNLDFLPHCDMLMCDGTFKSSPPLFDQFFIIHGLRQKRAFPLVFCLTPNRTAATYKKVWEAIKTLQPELKPRAIMSDFERASMNGFADVYPESEQKACYFHFRQAILRKLQKLPTLHEKYATDNDFAYNIKHLIALAFVPPEDVASAFELLMEEEFFVENEDLLVEFINYFETTWIGLKKRTSNARCSPLFSIHLWNCYHSVLEDTPKTNNYCEGFNRKFAVLLGASNPTIFKFIKGLKKQQAFTDTKMQQCLSGAIGAQVKPESIESLQKVVSEYGLTQFSVIEQLHRLAYRIIN